MPGLLSRRRPWPYHLQLVHPAAGSVGLTLVPNPQTGRFYEKKAVTGDGVTPAVFDYGAYDPFTEKPYVFGRLVGGFGEAVQRTASPTRYKVARRADASIGGRPILGPFFQAQTLPATAVADAGVQFLSAFDTWWLFRQRYALQRVGDTAWTTVKDFGGSAFVTSATTYAPVGAGGEQVYVATGDALWNYDAIIPWTNCALPVGMSANYVVRNNDELWIGSNGNVVRKTTGDPRTGAGAWGGPIYVGDASAGITGLASLGGQLFVYKTDGIYSVDTAGDVSELRPEFRLSGKRATNGSALGYWRDRLWFRFGDGYYYLTGGSTATITAVGPERLMEVADLPGVPVAFAGHDVWFGYLVVHDALTTTSRLLKYGTWIPTDGSTGDAPGWSFAEVWHGAIAEWAGQVTAMGVEGPITTTVGTLSFRRNPWLWVAFADGHVEYTPLPVGAPDPARDSACLFTTDESYVEWPDHTAMAQADVKHFRTFVGEGPVLDATNYATVSYRTDPAGAWTALPAAFTRSGLRVSTPAAGVTGLRLGVREYLVGTRTSTPEVSSVTLLEQVRPAMVKTLTATARAARHVARRDGTADRRTGEQIRAALQDMADGASAAGAGPVTAVLSDETSEAVDVVDYAARESPDGYGLAWDVDLKLVTFQTNTVFGIVDRAVETVDEYAGYSVDEMGVL